MLYVSSSLLSSPARIRLFVRPAWRLQRSLPRLLAANSIGRASVFTLLQALIIKGSLAFGVLNGARFLLFRTKFERPSWTILATS